VHGIRRGLCSFEVFRKIERVGHSGKISQGPSSKASRGLVLSFCLCLRIPG
jgi:hypothetical protein